jgi:tetratricopeptide (TPR) repeat protein
MKRLEQGISLAAMVVIAGLVLLSSCGGGGKATKRQPIERDKTYSIRMADSLFKAGRVSEALAELEQAIEREPDDASLHHTYGSYCLQSARYDDAIAAFRRALEIDPYLTDAHNMLGAVYMELGDHARAESEFREALGDPAYPTPHLTYLNLGLLYAEQGRDDEAVESMRKSVGIDPKYFKAHFELASMLDRIGNLLEAVREYEVAEPAFRNDGEYWYRRGFAYYRLGEKDKARDSLVRVRSIAPGSESAARADELLNVMD